MNPTINNRSFLTFLKHKSNADGMKPGKFFGLVFYYAMKFERNHLLQVYPTYEMTAKKVMQTGIDQRQ